MKRAIKSHSGDFAAIIVLLILAIVVSGYILNHERLRFPFIQSTPFTVNAEFQTGQAFTPGQGQQIVVSGVPVGLLGNVTLKNGIAVVQMNIDSKYKHMIHTNATAVARPRTGLQDMFIELDPGTPSAPIAKPGYTIPVQNTLPEVNVDEILASLDSDSRAYLDLLVNGAGQGLSGKGGSELAQVFERFEPTHRDLARLNKAVAARGVALRQLVHSLAVLNNALAQRQGQISSLVVSSSKVFRAFAADDQQISQAVALLPGTLRQTTETLGKVQTFADQLGPAATNLLPAARVLPAANQALSTLAVPATPIVKNQIRPFVIAARPTVRQLKPAAVNLAEPTTLKTPNGKVRLGAATPNLGKVFTVLNHFVNMVGYNTEPSGQHSYLWWLAWLDHNARTLFGTQDANGVFRPLFLEASCESYTELLSFQASAAALLAMNPVLTAACHLK